MANYDSNYEIAQAISEKIGVSPIPFDSVYSIALKIYKEIGGEETQFDSVYSILLGILPLAERGGSGTIEDVSVLPVASEYKNKVVRLTTDNNLYQSYLKSTKTITTNRLPDDQQIDKAYLYDTEDNSINYYKGNYHIICNDGETDGYLWYQEGYAVITLKDAETITNSDKYSGYLDVGVNVTIDDETKIITIDNTLSVLENYDFSFGEIIPIPAIYNAPESAQIGNAYIIDAANGYKGIYDGTLVTFINTNGSGEEVTGYKWAVVGTVDYIATSKPASEIYYDLIDNGNNTYSTNIDVTIWCVHPEGNINSEISSVSQEPASGEVPIYIPQLNAPDSEQVNNAYIYDIYGQHKYFYKGLESIVCTDGTINVPHWIMEGTDGTQENNSLFTTPTANSLYKTTYENAFGLLNYKPNYSGPDYNIFYDTNNNEWKSTANTESTSQMITNSGSAESVFDSGVNISTVKYQRTKTTEIWDWKALTNDWAVGAIYRYYNPDVAGTIYGSLEWITAILNHTMKDSTKVCLQKLQDHGFGDGTFLMVHFKSWNGTEWVEDKVNISVYNALNNGGIMSVDEFNAYVNEILNVKTNEYDAHNYFYITNFGIYLYDILWNTETMGFTMNEFSDAIAFPINTAIRPDYIETYPQKNG